MKRRGVAILGATGSVGTAAQDVLAAHAELFHVVGCASWRKGPALLAAARRLSARYMVLVDEEAAAGLRPNLRAGDPELRVGHDALAELVADSRVDVVLQGISGAAALPSSLAAVQAGKRLALANKESLVVAGPLLMAAAAAGGAEVVPIDSEHVALHQALRSGRRAEVKRLVLTASGGPFRGRRRHELVAVGPEEALAHPTWDMGPRITVDSATLMNKALELVEARWLFDIDPACLDVVVHPQSIVHGYVEFVDGSVVAQLGLPDMRVPIRYALGWPERLPADMPPLALDRIGRLDFEAPDIETFPGLALGFSAAARGGTAGAALNAADEAAVARFLAGELPFLGIVDIVADVVARHPFVAQPDLDDVMAVDAWARKEAQLACERAISS